MNKTNKEGLTFSEWLTAAGWLDRSGWPAVGKHVKARLDSAKAAWEAGEDPTDYRAEGTFSPVSK